MAAVPATLLGLTAFGTSGSILSALTAAGAVIVIPFVLVLCSALAVGLPLTTLLIKMRAESELAYTVSGVIFGIVAPSVGYLIVEGGFNQGALLMGILGAFSGGITGSVWWRNYREARAE